MNRTVDVVVVGAGVIGSACAYYLADAGLKVLLVEREAIGSGASTHATGLLHVAGGEFRTEAELRLGMESARLTRDLVPVLQEATGVEVLYQSRPFLRLALAEEEEWLIRSQIVWQEKLLPIKWINSGDVRSIEPRLTPAIRGAAYMGETIQLDSGRYTLALAMAAERRRAAILLRRVTGLLREGDRVVGVRHSGGAITSGAVVLAMGPWAALASPWLGFDVPVRPLKGERLQLQFDAPRLPVLVSSPRRGHMISRQDGFLSVGSTAGRDVDDRRRNLLDEIPRDGFAIRPTEEALVELVQRAVDVLPAAENAAVALHLAGVRPLSPDRMPLVGPVPGCPGAYLATGHGHKGIHLAAVTGRLIADRLTCGSTELPVSWDVVDPARFSGRVPASHVAARASED